MELWIAQQNIQHFEELLKTSVNPADRQRLQEMLFREVGKLAELNGENFNNDGAPFFTKSAEHAPRSSRNGDIHQK